MSSACTPHRLFGRRVRRKFASCFFARRMRLEEKTNAYNRKSPETSHGSIVFDFTGGSEVRRASAKKSKENEGNPVQNSPSHSHRISGGEGEPHVADKDYLVFCFGEDGAIDIVDDGDDHDKISTSDAESVGVGVGAQKVAEGDEKESKDGEIEEMNDVEGEQPSISKTEQYESCDSNLSDTSSGSFAFPILKIEEWMGSPVHMPKNGNQSVRLHCCRF